MDLNQLLSVLPYFAAAGVSAVVGGYALRRRAVPGARLFALGALAEAGWAAAYLAQRFSAQLSDLIFWNNVQFSMVLVAALGYLGFAFNYTGTDALLKRTLWRGLALLALLEGALIWGDGVLHLLRTRPHIDLSSGLPRLAFIDGPLFFTYALLAYGMVAYASLLLLLNLFSSPRIYRLQLSTVFLGMAIPWLVGLLSTNGVIAIPFHDLTPISFIPSNLLMFWALFRYHLFEVTPIARDILVERMSDGVVVLDPRRRIIDFNPAAREALGLSEAASTGKFLGRELPVLHQFVAHLIENPQARAEVSLDVRGKPARFSLESTPLYDNLNNLTGHLVILHDITEQKRVEEKLHQLAFSDHLTGALNRRAFFELVGPEFERSRRYRHWLGFILFDVDNFKKVNDTYGHLVGDQVLKTLAQTCLTDLRAADKLARYGGEEFMVMLPETDPESVQATAERLRLRVEQMNVDGVRITISLGVAVFDPADTTAGLDTLLGQADLALYQAKQAGRNQVCLWTVDLNSSEVLNGKPFGL